MLGVTDKIREHIEYVKKLETTDDIRNNNDETVSCLENDFHPVSESSRISSGCDSMMSSKQESHVPALVVTDQDDDDDVSPPSSAPVSVILSRPASPKLPPQSPRVRDEDDEVMSPFYCQRNIDQVPERNVSSPRDAVRVPVIKYHKSAPPSSPRTPVTDHLSVTSTAHDLSTAASPYLASYHVTGVSPQPPVSITQLCEESMIHQEVKDEPTPDNTCQPMTNIPTFFKPLSSLSVVLEASFVNNVQKFFASLPDKTAAEDDDLSSILQVHPFFNSTIHRAVSTHRGQGSSAGVKCDQFITFLQVNAGVLYNTEESMKMFHLLSGCSRNYLQPDDFYPLIRTFIQTHPQLEFFRSHEFRCLHDSYIISIIASMFAAAGCWRNKRMFWRHFLKLDLVQLLTQLSDPDTDLSLTHHFSYDQFYLFYTQFYQLDQDNDHMLSRDDLAEFEEGRLTGKIVSRIFLCNVHGKEMLFWDWVLFLLADIDKTSDFSMEFWFPVLDSNSDGLISVADLKELYYDNIFLLVTGNISNNN